MIGNPLLSIALQSSIWIVACVVAARIDRSFGHDIIFGPATIGVIVGIVAAAVARAVMMP